jgi:hypothetical protein
MGIGQLGSNDDGGEEFKEVDTGAHRDVRVCIKVWRELAGTYCPRKVGLGVEWDGLASFPF